LSLCVRHEGQEYSGPVDGQRQQARNRNLLFLITTRDEARAMAWIDRAIWGRTAFGTMIASLSTTSLRFIRQLIPLGSQWLWHGPMLGHLVRLAVVEDSTSYAFYSGPVIRVETGPVPRLTFSAAPMHDPLVDPSPAWTRLRRAVSFLSQSRHLAVRIPAA